ncbi:hypothetical protein ACEPAG_7537 [Sanghuangporus baumii]
MHNDNGEASLVKIPDYLTLEEASTLPLSVLTAYNSPFRLIPLKGRDAGLVQGSDDVSVVCLLLKQTNGRGVDHFVEIAGAETILRSINAVKMSSPIRSIGFLAHVIDFVTYSFSPGARSPSSEVLDGLLSKAAHLRAVLIGPRKQFENMNHLFDTAETRPIIDRVFKDEEYPDALKHLTSQQHVGNVKVAQNRTTSKTSANSMILILICCLNKNN